MQNIVVIGAGNLAWHLVVILQRAGYRVTLTSRQPETVADWPVRVQTLADLMEVPDLIILAVPDDAIELVSTNLSFSMPDRIPVVHTSGATPVARIDAYFKQRGALWPIKSLRKGSPVGDWREVPIVYHGIDEALTQVLGKLCSKVSDQAYPLNDEQRARLHLSAVFSNNFVSWMYQISHELCTEADIPFKALLPLIRDTAIKQDGTPPKLTQTGAAARGDTATISNHLELLEGKAEYTRLYHFMSNLIRENMNNKQ